MYRYKPTELIAEALNKHGIYFEVEYKNELEKVSVFSSINCGPDIKIYILVNDNNVGLRIWGIINEIPQPKRYKIMEVCNTLNSDYRFTKFAIDKDNELMLVYDFPQNNGECIGEMAVEILRSTKSLLNEKYELFMKELYTDEDELEKIKQQKRVLCEMREMIIENNRRIYKRNRRWN